MPAIHNPVKARLEAGEIALGIGLRMARSVEIAPLMATAGFDFLFIDLEHGVMSLDLAGQISVAASASGIAPVVRVPGFEHHHASRALDAGALGIVFPHVEDAETAARLASYCRYPPAGTRSIAAGLAQLQFRAVPMAEATRTINEAVQVVVMVETIGAVRKVHEIAAAPGVDVVLIGTNDLSIDLGVPGQLDHPDLVRALEEVLRACSESGATPGLGGVYQPDLMRRYMGMGFRWITTGSDLGLLLEGARRQVAAARSTSPAGG